jgi:GNAT superfamily N-acetyltransferase
VSTQRRARAGGETGANGEWYEGGKFIATQDNAKRAGRSRKPTRKVEVEPWKWELPPEEGMRPIYGRMGAGVFTGKLDDGQWGLIARDVTWRYYFNTESAIARAKEEYQAFADRFNAGERWTTPEEDRAVARAAFLGAGGEMPAPVYAVSDDEAQDILDILRSVADRRPIWSSGVYTIAVDDYSESSSLVLSHRDEIIGFYEGSCLWLDERHRGKGLSTPLILAAATERSRDSRPTVLPTDVDCHGYSPAGLAAHEKAFTKLWGAGYDLRVALERCVVNPPLPTPTATDSDAVRQAKQRFLAEHGPREEETAGEKFASTSSPLGVQSRLMKYV